MGQGSSGIDLGFSQFGSTNSKTQTARSKISELIDDDGFATDTQKNEDAEAEEDIDLLGMMDAL